MDKTDPIVAAGCGTCGDLVAASHVPDWCRACRSRFDLGAPVAVVSLHLEAHAGGIRVATRTRFVGEWSVEIRDRVSQALEGVEAGNAPNARKL